MSNEEKKILLKEIKSVAKLEFPKFELPSIPKEGLIEQKSNSLIFYTSGSYLNKKTGTLHINTKETFNGKIEIIEDKYFITEGEYKWSSGQKYVGKFVKNNLNVGTLHFPEGYFFNGEFEDDKFKKGEFRWNENEYTKGEFKDGELEGEATIQKDNCYIEGNFVNSKPENRIKKCIIRRDNHKYELSNFDIKKGEIEQKRLTIKKDGNKVLLIISSSSKMKDRNSKKQKELQSKNKNESRITKDEINNLNKCFNLINDIVPKIEPPSIEKELKVQKEEELNYILENGLEAKYDEDLYSYSLTLPKKETFIGQIDDNDNKIIYLLEGEYKWPSGQIYNGKFNKDNQFDSEGEEVELKFKDEWIYKGTFEKGYIMHGKFIWNNKGEKEYSLEAYFSEGKINGIANIKWGDLEIKGNFEETTIQYFEASINGHVYKIDFLYKDITEEEDVIIEKDDNDYFIVQYTVEKNNVKIDLNNKLNIGETNLILESLKNKISFPQLLIPSINKGGLEAENENIIYFNNDITFNTKTNVLSLPNKETFKGKLGKDSNKYWLEEGEYEWPSGQKYTGNFNTNNMFENNSGSKLIIKSKENCIYEGGFKDGRPNGKGEINWNNGDEIKGVFVKGKINGETIVKKNNIFFKGEYNSSFINGDMNDINVKINGQIYEIKNISIYKGKIEGLYLDVKVYKNNNGDSDNLKIQLTKEDKNVIPSKEYESFEKNEDIYILFKILKFLQKLRNFNFPEYSLPMIEGEELTKKENHEKRRIDLPNGETIKKYEYKIIDNKFYLISAEYKWPTGQKYDGNFKNNVFESECSSLKYKDIWEYKGGFKNGEVEGKGDFHNYIKGEYISGNFEKGKINGDTIYFGQEYDFKGKIDSLDKLYIKSLKNKIQNIEICDFKIDDKIIKYKRDDINFVMNLTTGKKIKIIELLIANTYVSKRKFYYNEPFEKEESKENQLKILKIKDNIKSQKLNKLAIYCDKLEKYNRVIKEEIGKIFGININQEINNSEFMNKIKRISFNKNDAINVTYKIKQAQQMREDSLKDEYYDELEVKEIMKVCNSKMLKEIRNEIDLICDDIITLKKEKAWTEKEKKNKIIERNDLIYYYNVLNDNYNELINEREEIKREKAEIEKSILNLKEINVNKMKFTNKKLLEKIKEQNDKIKKENEEKEKLRQEIEELKKKLKNKNKNK